MKNYTLTIAFIVIALSVGVVHSCKKESMSTPDPYSSSPITQSFTEEFKDFYTLTGKSGWITYNNNGDIQHTTYDDWGQGQVGKDKNGNETGLTAFSSSKSKDEYAYSVPDPAFTMSSWLITPILSVKNGDKFSFYTSTVPGAFTSNRLQVLMSPTGESNVGDSVNAVGQFTSLLLDINPTEGPGLFPTTWKQYEYTFTDLPAKTEIRIGFRHYETNTNTSGAIGIDQFKFTIY